TLAEQKLATRRRDLEREAALPEARVHVLLQLVDVLVKDRAERLGVERLIGHHGVNPIDKLWRKAPAHGRQCDTLQLARHLCPFSRATGLEANLGMALAHHLTRPQIAREENEALFKIDRGIVPKPQEGFVQDP